MIVQEMRAQSAAVLRRRLVNLSLLAELALYHSAFLGWAPRGDGSRKKRWDQCECLGSVLAGPFLFLLLLSYKYSDVHVRVIKAPVEIPKAVLMVTLGCTIHALLCPYSCTPASSGLHPSSR